MNEVIYLCPACSASNRTDLPPRGVLKTVYSYPEIRKGRSPVVVLEKLREESYLPLLPLHDMNSWPALRIGKTPLYRTGPHMGLTVKGVELFLKDDSQNPTFSFKDRASALVSAWAKEHGIHTLVAASTGNAGSSLAGICAAQRQEAFIIVPAAAPLAKLTQILMYGATLIPVKGTYDDAFNLSVRVSERYGFYNRNTAFNPLTIEGKKTVSFELLEQLGRVPDRIFVPVGDGVIYSGVCRGFEDLLELGIIDRMPILVAVQSAGSANLVSNLGPDSFRAIPSNTIADSISVDVPRCFHMTAAFIRKYKGETVTVSDGEILEASGLLARSSGLFAEPAAAAAYAGFRKEMSSGNLVDGSINVVLLTGSGLKDLAAVRPVIRMPEAVEPSLEAATPVIESGL